MNSIPTVNPSSRVYVAGHHGLVGSALVRALQQRGVRDILTRDRKALDLTDAAATLSFLRGQAPDIVVVAAARVGGIGANSTFPAEFIQQNLAIALNLIHGAWTAGIKRLLFLGSSCIYPREAPQPMTEDCLLTSPLEASNEPYAIAKIAGLKLCGAYRKQYGVMYHSAMPTNLYGPRDNYHPFNSHVIPALLRRFDEARDAGLPEVVMWGTGTPRREFLHADDLAAACMKLLELDNPPNLVNIGSGQDLTLLELAGLIKETVGYGGKIVFDPTKPDGTPRKLLDISRIKSCGWQPSIGLREGLMDTYEHYKADKGAGVLREV